MTRKLHYMVISFAVTLLAALLLPEERSLSLLSAY